ncbi:peroxidase [Ixodes scapularis]
MRPISLISHAGKLMERMALMGLERHVEDNNVLHYCQTGFRRGLSTRDSLTLLAEDLTVGDSVTATWTHGTRKRRSPAREPAAPRSTMRIPDTLLLGVLAFLVGVSADITVSGDLESVGNLAGETGPAKSENPVLKDVASAGPDIIQGIQRSTKETTLQSAVSAENTNRSNESELEKHGELSAEDER